MLPTAHTVPPVAYSFPNGQSSTGSVRIFDYHVGIACRIHTLFSDYLGSLAKECEPGGGTTLSTNPEEPPHARRRAPVSCHSGPLRNPDVRLAMGLHFASAWPLFDLLLEELVKGTTHFICMLIVDLLPALPRHKPAPTSPIQRPNCFGSFPCDHNRCQKP